MIHTAELDVPSLLAAMRRLGWTFADLSSAARMPLEHLDALVAGRTFSPRSVARIVDVVNVEMERRGAA